MSLTRIRGWMAAVLAASVLLVLLGAHAPPVRLLARRQAINWLASQGLRVSIDTLSYNLLTLTVRLRGVRVAAAGAGIPFLAVRDVRLDLPWRALLGTVRIDDAELTGLALTVVRQADGSLNLPASRGGDPLARFDLGRVRLEQASLRYDDQAGDVHVEAGDIALDLRPPDDRSAGRRGVGARSVGRLTMGRGLSVRSGAVTVAGTFGGTLAYDGMSMTTDTLTFASPVGHLRLDGRVGLFGPAPSMTLALSGAVALDQLSTLVALQPAAMGLIGFSGRMDGPVSTPTATLALTSADVRWRHLAARDLNARALATMEGLTIETLALRLGGGTAEAHGRIGFDPLQATGTASWHAVPLSALADLAPAATQPSAPRASWRTATRLSGHVTASGARTAGRTTLAMDGSVSAIAPQGVSLKGHLTITASGGTWKARPSWRLNDALTVDGTLNGQVPAAGLTHSSLRGTLNLSADDLTRLAMTGEQLGFWSAGALRPDAGRAALGLRVAGTLAAPTITGALQLTDGQVAGAGPLSASLTMTADLHRVALDAIEVGLGGNHGTGRASLEFARDGLDGAFDVTLTDFAALGGPVTNWRPSGDLRAHVSLGGTTTSPTGAATVSGANIELAGQTLGALSATATASASAVSLTTAEMRQPDGGVLTASGAFSLPGGPHTLRLQAQGLRVSPVTTSAGTWTVAAVATGAFDLRGTTSHPAGGGHLDLTALQWDTAHIERAEADVTLSDAGAAVRVEAPALALVASATIALTAPYAIAATAAATHTDVATLLDALGPMAPPQLRSVAGLIGARATVTGSLDHLPDLMAEASIDQLDLHTGEARLHLNAPASVRYAASTFTVQQLRLRTGSTTGDVTGGVGPAAPEGMTVSVNGPLSDLQPWLTATGGPSGLGLDGLLMATAHASGTLEQTVLTGSVQLEAGRLAWPGYPAVTEAVATLTLQDGVIDVPVLRGRWEESALDGQARVPLRFLDLWLPANLVPGGSPADPGASMQLRVVNITPAVLTSFVDETTTAALKGRAGLQVDLRADRPALERVTGSMLVTQLSMSAEGVPIEQVRPTRIEVAAGALRAADWEWTLGGSPVRVTGTAGLVADGALDLQVAGRLDLRVFGLFLPAGASDGTGDLSMAIRGTVQSPVADGTMRLSSGEFRLASPRVGLSNATGVIALRPGRIEVASVTGMLNGGGFSLHGGLDYSAFKVTGGTLTFDATRMALDVPTGMRTEVNASLSLAIADRAQLSGRVDVLQGAYREPLSLATALATAARQRETTMAGDDAPSLLSRIDLNVAVASTEDLAVDNNYGRLDLGLDLRLVGTLAGPSAVGRATVREGGVLFLGGRTYLVDRGVIDFSDPHAIVPQLDLSARTRVDGANDAGSPTQYDITLTLTGMPDTLKTTLVSVPDRPQADIVSLLATGRLADQVGGAGGAIARDQFLGYLSGETLGFAARAIGFDSIRFERGASQDALSSDASIAGEVNPAQRLTVSRRISGRAEVTVSQNLRDTGRFTWIAAVTPRRAVELRAISQDDQSRVYEVRHDVAFGGPAAPPRGADQTAAPRVSGVRFTGDPRVPTAELQRRLKLKAGSRFNFYRWQQDRDRLRRLYLDRTYREVRVSARQMPETGADGVTRVALEYAVTAGTLTAIEVEGDPLPKGVMRELEQVWNNAVVDIGLTGDVTAAVQRHLAGEGYLRARVRTTRVPPDTASGVTQLRLRIARGPHSASRVVAVSGNARVATAAIDAVVTRLGVGAWLTSRTLAEELTRLYRQHGHLAATVTAGPVAYTASAATLPVRIQEGAAFTVGRVVVTGAGARTEAAVRQDFGLTEGAPYTPDGLQRARLALARAYAVSGFNAMTEETSTLVNREAATVEVRVSLREGPQQVLAGAVVTGADGVHAGVVTDALNVSPGAPVNLEAWYAGRRRLFQTGLFRRVDVEAAPTLAPGSTATVERVQADVTLVRLQPWRLRYGVNVTDETAPVADQGRAVGGGLSATLERQGLFGRPGSSVASVRYNNDQRVARGTLTWPTLFGRPLSSRLYVSRSRDLVSGNNVLSFITDRTILTAEQRLTVGARAQVAYAYQFERNHVFDPTANPSDPFALDERWRQARLTASLVVDRRNSPLEPEHGTLHSSTVEYGLEALGRSGRFVKYSLQELLFARLTRGVVSASAARLNLGKGFGQDLILSERFFAGGTSTVRGYANDSLGGFDFFGDAIPGQATLVLNQEVRFPLVRWARGAAFVDAGDVYERARDLSLRTLQVGAGLGLRLSTPVGLFRLDLATPVPRASRPVRYTFGFGHTF